MSFLNVLGKVLHAGEAAAIISAPVISTINPVAGAVTQLLVTSIIRAEQIYADKPKSGADKAQFTRDETTNALQALNLILASVGKTPIDIAAVHGTITPVVEALNAVAAIVSAAGTAKKAE